MTEPDPPQSAANRAYWDEYFRLKYRIVLLSLKTAEWFYDAQVRSNEDTPDEVEAAYNVVDEEFDTAVHEFFRHNIRAVPD